MRFLTLWWVGRGGRGGSRPSAPTILFSVEDYNSLAMLNSSSRTIIFVSRWKHSISQHTHKIKIFRFFLLVSVYVLLRSVYRQHPCMLSQRWSYLKSTLFSNSLKWNTEVKRNLVWLHGEHNEHNLQDTGRRNSSSCKSSLCSHSILPVPVISVLQGNKNS